MTHTITPPADMLALLDDGRASIALLVDAYRTLCGRGGETRAEKQAVVERLGLELTLNAQVEQDILDPVLRVAPHDPSLMHLARDSAWALVAHLSTGEPGETQFDTRLLLLADDLGRRSVGAQREIARRAEEARLDLIQLGADMAARKLELLEAYQRDAQDGVATEDESADPVGQPVAPPLRVGD
jgi:hypothetical protein